MNLKVWDMAGELIRLFEQHQTAEDEDTRLMLEAQISTWFGEMGGRIDVYHDAMGRLESETARVKAEADAMAARAQRLAGRLDWFQGRLLAFAIEHGATVQVGKNEGKALVGTEGDNRFVASQTAGACEILDEGSIPAKYVDIVPAERKIRKGDILKELRAGNIVPGAQLRKNWKLERK